MNPYQVLEEDPSLQPGALKPLKPEIFPAMKRMGCSPILYGVFAYYAFSLPIPYNWAYGPVDESHQRQNYHPLNSIGGKK